MYVQVRVEKLDFKFTHDFTTANVFTFTNLKDALQHSRTGEEKKGEATE